MVLLSRIVTMMDKMVGRLGAPVIAYWSYFVELVELGFSAVHAAFFEEARSVRAMVRVISSQIYFTGWEAVPIISALALGTGSIIVLHSSMQASLIGDHQMIGDLVVVIAIRELAPLVTALVVIARSGTAIASDLGNMKVNHELDALRAMAINPMSYLIFPRLAGGLISVVCLAIYFCVAAVLGGYLLTHSLHNFSFDFYMGSIAQAITLKDIGLFLIKNIVSGLIIFLVACAQGLKVKGSSHEVPQVTGQAVVISLKGVTFFNFMVTAIFSLPSFQGMGFL